MNGSSAVNSTRILTIVVALGIVGVAALGWVLGISPVLSSADAASSQSVGVEAQNSASRASIAALQKQLTGLPGLEARLADLETSIPTTPDTDGFLDQLQALATRSGVTLATFTAAEPATFGPQAGAGAPDASAAPAPATSPSPAPSAAPSPSAPPSVAGSAGAAQSNLFTVAISVTVNGSPDQVMAFTRAVQSGPRLFYVKQVGFTADEPASGTISGSIFVIRDSVGGDATSP